MNRVGGSMTRWRRDALERTHTPWHDPHALRGGDGNYCRACGQGWPCDVRQLLDALTEAERERDAQRSEAEGREVLGLHRQALDRLRKLEEQDVADRDAEPERRSAEEARLIDALAASEARYWRLVEAIGDHGRCTCRQYAPLWPAPDGRHHPECGYDPGLRAAMGED